MSMTDPEPPPRARPPRRVLSESYGRALAEAGLIANINDVQRIVVDVRAGHALTVWVAYYGDDRWLDVLPPEGVMVRGEPAGVDAERLEAARRALLEDGFFREDQVGDDVAPRIIERLADLRRSLTATQQAMAMQEKVVCYRIGGHDIDPADVTVVYQPLVDGGPPDDGPAPR